MELATILPWAIFGAITFGIWALMNVWFSRTTRASERLDELRDPTLRGKDRAQKKDKSKGFGEILKKAAPTISKALKPKTDLEQNQLKVKLANAGFNSPSVDSIYLALQVTLLVGGLLIGLSYGLLHWGLRDFHTLAVTVFSGAGGFYIPKISLYVITKGRKEKIFLALPDALDLLVVCVEAGLGLDAGMRKLTEELADSHPEMCEELALCNMQLQMGRARREVLHDLGVRTGVDDMRSLAAILIQADKFGSSIAHALRVQSDSMRVKRRQMAEERAQQSSVKMIFPLVLFIFPGIFVVLVGPAAMLMMEKLLK